MDGFMDILPSMKKDLHINLPKKDLAYLEALAKEKGCSRNDLVCEAVTAYRVSQEKAGIEARMRAYVEKHGKHSLEITKEFEPHVMEMLHRETEW